MNSGPRIGESAPHFLLSPSFSPKRPHRFIWLPRGKHGGFTPNHLPTLFLSKFLGLIVWIVSGTAERCSSPNFPGGGGATLGLNTAVFSLANEGRRNLNRERDIFFCHLSLTGLARSISSTSLRNKRKARMEVFIKENHLLVYISSTHPSIPQIFVELLLYTPSPVLGSGNQQGTKQTKILAFLKMNFWLGAAVGPRDRVGGVERKI